MEWIKKVTIKLFLFVLIVSLGCTKDEPNPSIVGTWKEGRIITGCPNGFADKSTPCSGSCNAVFSATTFTDTDLTVYNYKVDGNTLTLTSNTGGAGSIKFTFELKLGTLILATTNQSNSCVLTIYYTKI
jgi:hypothetical protein